MCKIGVNVRLCIWMCMSVYLCASCKSFGIQRVNEAKLAWEAWPPKCAVPPLCVFTGTAASKRDLQPPKTLINVFGQQQRTPISCCCVWGSAYENGCELNLILHRINEVAGNYHTAVIISVHVPQGFWHNLRNMGGKKPENVSVHLISFIHIQVCFVEACLPAVF